MASFRANRGGYRGSRGGGYRGRGAARGFGNDDVLPGDRDIMEGLQSTAIETIAVPAVADGGAAFTGELMENVEVRAVDYCIAGRADGRYGQYVASYNFSSAAGEPTIVVPGAHRPSLQPRFVS